MKIVPGRRRIVESKLINDTRIIYRIIRSDIEQVENYHALKYPWKTNESTEKILCIIDRIEFTSIEINKSYIDIANKAFKAINTLICNLKSELPAKSNKFEIGFYINIAAYFDPEHGLSYEDDFRSLPPYVTTDSDWEISRYGEVLYKGDAVTPIYFDDGPRVPIPSNDGVAKFYYWHVSKLMVEVWNPISNATGDTLIDKKIQAYEELKRIMIEDNSDIFQCLPYSNNFIDEVINYAGTNDIRYSIFCSSVQAFVANHISEAEWKKLTVNGSSKIIDIDADTIEDFTFLTIFDNGGSYFVNENETAVIKAVIKSIKDRYNTSIKAYIEDSEDYLTDTREKLVHIKDKETDIEYATIDITNLQK